MGLSDRHYLRNEQYRDASNLTARGELHERFSTNQYGWHRWVFDRLELPAHGRLLELGCGPGWLWRENAARLPATWAVTLSDFSPGMVRESERHLAAVGPGRRARFSFVVADAGAIPFGAASFDAVVANHMLYHLPDLAGALAEVRRVLRPGGRFYAATNGRAHLWELDELLARFDPAVTRTHAGGFHSDRFTLERGSADLASWFPTVALDRYEDALVVTEAMPLVAYVLSTPILPGGRRVEFAAFVEREVARRGAIRISKDAGLLMARRDGGD